jgi:hypothetical protein
MESSSQQYPEKVFSLKIKEMLWGVSREKLEQRGKQVFTAEPASHPALWLLSLGRPRIFRGREPL